MSNHEIKAIRKVENGEVVETIYLTEEESTMVNSNPFLGLPGVSDSRRIQLATKRLIRNIFQIFYRRNPAATTYEVFKPYYKKIGKKFSRKDAEVVQKNLIRVARKLYEIHCRKTEKIDAELEKRTQ